MLEDPPKTAFLNRPIASTNLLKTVLAVLNLGKASSHLTGLSTIQSISFCTSRRIDRNSGVCARFALTGNFNASHPETFLRVGCPIKPRLRPAGQVLPCQPW